MLLQPVVIVTAYHAHLYQNQAAKHSTTCSNPPAQPPDMSDHAENHDEEPAESSPSSTCGLSSDLVDGAVADAARGSDALLANVMESVSGALGWLFAQEEDGAAAPGLEEAIVEEGAVGAVQDEAAEEAQVQTHSDENTIPPPPPPPPANAETETDEQAEACTGAPTKVAAAAITSEDTVASNSSASSDNDEDKKEQRSSRAKLVGVIAVGLVLIIAIVVGAVIGASGNSGNASVQRFQGASTQNNEETDSYPSESDGGGMEVVTPTAPVQQSPLPTDRPSLRPTPSSADDIVTAETTPSPIEDSPPENTVDDAPTSFSFYVLGDVPYNPNQKIIVEDQILHLSEDIVDDDLFLIHVGDAMNAKQGCNEKDFVFMRDLLTSGLPELPSFIIPGDNDWNDCPSRSAAWKLWEKHFMAFENNWNGTEKFAAFQGSTVQRQSIRKENFSFVAHGVLFFSLHWLGGAKDTRTAARMADNDAWIEEQVQEHGESIEGGRIRAVVIFAHALTKSDLSQNSLQVIQNSFEQYDVPVVLFKGDKHTFEICDSFLGVGWNNFKIVQVDQGGNAPPVRVSILGDGMSSASAKEPNATIALADFIHLDRRGGLYSWAPTDQLSNACGAVSRGEVY